MAISLMNAISWKFTGKPWDLNSYPLTPDEVWAKLDLPPEEVRVALNALIGVLNSVTAGSSGAGNLAMTPITAIGTQATVQSIVEAIVTRLQAVTAGLSGAKFIGVETIAGLTGNDVQTLLSALKTLSDGYNTAQTNALGTHKTSTDHDGRYFTETELGANTGAGLVGATAPSGLTGTTTQALINALKTAIDNTVLGQIPDSSLTNVKLSTDIKVGSLAALNTTAKTDVVSAVNEHLSATSPHGAVIASTANKIALRDASGNLTSKQVISDIASGTAPLIVTSPTVVSNLNADMVDGVHANTIAQVLSGGNRIQAGSGTLTVTTGGSSASGLVTFPVPFATTPLMVVSINSSGWAGAGYLHFAVRDDLNNISAVVLLESYTAQTVRFNWIAIGT